MNAWANCLAPGVSRLWLQILRHSFFAVLWSRPLAVWAHAGCLLALALLPITASAVVFASVWNRA